MYRAGLLPQIFVLFQATFFLFFHEATSSGILHEHNDKTQSRTKLF